MEGDGSIDKAPDEKILCVCLYDYTGEEPGDLSFKKHEVLEVITKDCSAWWKC
eukprot:Awhi_evm1s14223